MHQHVIIFSPQSSSAGNGSSVRRGGNALFQTVHGPYLCTTEINYTFRVLYRKQDVSELKGIVSPKI